MTNDQLKEKLSKMTLEQKLLELTQYTYHDFAQSAQENVVTGTSNTNGLTAEQYLRVGSILNTSGGTDCETARKLRADNGIEEPIVIKHNVIHGYCTQYPIPLALAGSFNLQLTEQCAEMAAT